ncbi:MarR family transcriptional regulator [bacterium SCSIO 12741]|nr:MarR family transcriptional regulator [bacterium SCSIO 12741]
MRIEDEIKQKQFKSDLQRALVNLHYTYLFLNRTHSERLKPYGISSQQFNILRILRGQYPNPASIKLLTERMMDKMSNASRLVDKLLAKKLVERTSCPEDRRRVDVVITEKGLELIEKASNELDGAAEKFKLTSEEAIELSRLLDKMRE